MAIKHFSGVTHIIMDVEGTTTSISFVHDVLFPYAAKHLAAFLKDNSQRGEISECLRQVATVAKSEGRMLCSPGDYQGELQRWIREDRKHPALKMIQGLIWRQGYNAGELLGHVYPDVKPAWQQWHAQGLHMGIYSSGSVEAQRLIFGHSSAGNLNTFLSYNFDTAVGAKRESSSYHNILKRLNVAAENVLFLSDIVAELDAAKSAGMQTGLLVRDHEVPENKAQHPILNDFSAIVLN